LNYVSDFLKSNPSETVIIQVKEEGSGKGNFVDKVNSELSKNSRIYHSAQIFSNVTMDEVRGKIVVISPSGINSSYKYNGWGDNPECRSFSLGGSTAVAQDKYKAVTETEKMTAIENYYNNVWRNYSGQNIVYINFTSCVGPACPKLVAKEINKSFEKFVNDNKTKKFGIVNMDDPSSSLIELIYSLNKS
ncbi:MAG: hypothetical protein IKE05_00625, partial [Clostridia bacterium]|nr:hypothetical protein [Clostridia bacterium]